MDIMNGVLDELDQWKSYSANIERIGNDMYMFLQRLMDKDVTLPIDSDIIRKKMTQWLNKDIEGK
jgi:hypothetical protein